jgi:hypothetical protein
MTPCPYISSTVEIDLYEKLKTVFEITDIVTLLHHSITNVLPDGIVVLFVLKLWQKSKLLGRIGRKAPNPAHRTFRKTDGLRY